ncbi:hypothetical protein Ae201684_012297 [Aphanomyces euteiches]|uniref:Uncharacterized protein n=1 Tax=Aphanomyces euteiches TaxID=100861 RepID=A0A6G0WS92_9STRA|nr:hypothetical protein Ae201684_012297 [Aphanomyces euteiches]
MPLTFGQIVIPQSDHSCSSGGTAWLPAGDGPVGRAYTTILSSVYALGYSPSLHTLALPLVPTVDLTDEVKASVELEQGVWAFGRCCLRVA